MVPPAACPTTHPQIRLGDCPWCGARLRDGQPATDLPDAAGGRSWDTARMVADLDSGDEAARQATVMNLVEHPPDLDSALPVLRKAMDDARKPIRDRAVQAIFRLAMKLDPDGLGPYEARLREDLSELATLLLVLVVYSMGQFHSSAVRLARQQLALRVIEEMPEFDWAGSPIVCLDPLIDGEASQQARHLWLQHVEARPEDARVIGNAAHFFSVWDDVRSGELLRRSKALEPENPGWSWYLGCLYVRTGFRKTREECRDWAAMGLVEYERALVLAEGDPEWSSLLLQNLARAAFESGDIAKARDYSERLLAFGATQEEPWRRVDAIHHGHQFLGRIALAEGDLAQAKSRLIASATPTDPCPLVIPDVTLAEELLERGERDVVLDFFHRCSSLVTSGNLRDKVAGWIVDVERGQAPDFRLYSGYWRNPSRRVD